MKISVVVVTLNSGNELFNTVMSIINQDFVDFEVIIKDGLSNDNSLSNLPKDSRIHIFRSKDSGIYDAMNQSIKHITGDYCLFLNTGDKFINSKVLTRIDKEISKKQEKRAIYYGDCYTKNRNSMLIYPDHFDDYTCFSMVLCHQATLYPSKMLKKRGFNLKYEIAADYEYYIREYISGTKLMHLPITIVEYKGDGASENTKNRRKAINESSFIRKSLFPRDRYWSAWLKAQIHLVGIKQFLVQQELFYPLYKKLAFIYYKYKNWRVKS